MLGFPTLEVGTPRTRIIMVWGLNWGQLSYGNCHVARALQSIVIDLSHVEELTKCLSSEAGVLFLGCC